jgi:hypothetical protein
MYLVHKEVEEMSEPKNGKKYFRPQVRQELQPVIRKLAKAEKSSIPQFLTDVICLYISKVEPSLRMPEIGE